MFVDFSLFRSRSELTTSSLQLPGQRASACTCEGEDHPGPRNSVGRGGPESKFTPLFFVDSFADSIARQSISSKRKSSLLGSDRRVSRYKSLPSTPIIVGTILRQTHRSPILLVPSLVSRSSSLIERC